MAHPKKGRIFYFIRGDKPKTCLPERVRGCASLSSFYFKGVIMRKLLLSILSISLLLGCVAPNKSVIKKMSISQPWSIMTEYDKFRDYTTVSLSEMKIKSDWIDASSLSIKLHFLSKGISIQTPEEISLILISMSKDWKYIKRHSLILLIDNERIDFGDMSYDSKIINYRKVMEYMRINIPIEIFLKIANANNVEGQLFATEFILKEEHLEAFRDFANRFQ